MYAIRSYYAVTAVQDNGIEVAVQDGLTGFIRKADLSRDRSEQRPDRFASGEKVDAKITAFDPKSRKISLSIKAREVDEDKQAMKEYGSSDSGAILASEIASSLVYRGDREAEFVEVLRGHLQRMFAA